MPTSRYGSCYFCLKVEKHLFRLIDLSDAFQSPPIPLPMPFHVFKPLTNQLKSPHFGWKIQVTAVSLMGMHTLQLTGKLKSGGIVEDISVVSSSTNKAFASNIFCSVDLQSYLWLQQQLHRKTHLADLHCCSRYGEHGSRNAYATNSLNLVRSGCRIPSTRFMLSKK